MDSTARAKANVPRPGKRQTLTGLDSYHRYVREQGRSRDGAERPYAGHAHSFSIPRPSTHTPSSSNESNKLSPETTETESPVATASELSLESEWPAYKYPALQNTGTKETLPKGTSQSSGSPDPQKNPRLLDIPLPWRPFYLQRRVLLSFALLFAALIVALEAVLDLSNRNTGLGSPAQGFRYVWQYGATTILTLVAAMWALIELQAKASAPWMRMSKGPADVDKTLLLDYTSMFLPWSVVRAFKNGDWLVACVSLVSMTFKVLIVVAVALIAPTFTNVMDNAAGIMIQSTFVNDNSGLRNTGSLAFFTMIGLQTTDLEFPDGTSKQFAYQSFTTDLPATAEVHVAVDGFEGGLDCEVARLNLDGIQFLQSANTQLNITVSTASCVTKHVVPNNVFLSSSGQQLPKQFMALQPGGCDNSTNIDDQRVVVMSGAITLDLTSFPRNSTTRNVPVVGSLQQSAALICRPTYALTVVDVVKNGTQLLSIGRSRTAKDRTLREVHPWDIAAAHFDSYNNAAESINTVPSTAIYYDGKALIDTDSPIDAAMAMRVRDMGGVPPTLESLSDANNLKGLATAYWQQYTALLARNSLMGGVQVPVVGKAVLVGQRLVVGALPTQLLAGLLGFVLLLTFAIIILAPKKGFLPRDPSTVIDMATLLAHSRQLLQCLRGTGAADEETIREKLKDSTYSIGVEAYEKSSESGLGYFKIFGGNPPAQDTPPEFLQTANWGHPLPLHHWVRLGGVLVIGGMIAGLEALLRVSDRNGGIATVVANNIYIQFVWTTGPAVLFTMLATYASSVDFATRCLAPYSNLKQGGSFRTSVGLDFLNKSTPSIIVSAIKTKNLAILVASFTVLAASLLAIFSGALYTLEPIAQRTSITLQTLDFFGNSSISSAQDDICTTCNNDTILASLILDANLTYPAFTFEDLNFQTLEWQGVLPQDANSTEVTIEATISAIRPNMNCRLYPTSQITTNLTVNYEISGSVNPLRIDIAGEPCRITGEIFGSNALIATAPGGFSRSANSAVSSNAFFGSATTKIENVAQCSDLLFVWGQVDKADTNETTVRYVSAMGCNETLETVSTNVVFHGTELRIDPLLPPVVDEGSAQTNAVVLESLMYAFLANLSSTHLLDPFFTSLIASRFAVPAETLGESNLEVSGRVADAIVRQHKIIRAQSLNIHARRHLTPAGEFPLDIFREPTIVNGLDPLGPASKAQPIIDATLNTMNSTSLRRLVQDTTSTRILQSILSLLLALFITAWLLTPGTDAILPRNPCSIASVAALLADGNVFGFLGRGAEWMTSREIERGFMDGKTRVMGFKMGWEKVRRRRREEDRGLWGVGAGRNEERAFSISVARAGGWGGGEEVGLGIVARVGMGQRGFVRGWGRE